MEKEDRGKIGKLSYKYVIAFCILVLIWVMLIAFSIYTYYNYQKECEEIAGREAVNLSAQAAGQVDERLDNLKQYYVSWMDEEDCIWVLENQLHYSDCSKYQAASEVMAGKNIFGNYISGYTFVNFKTGWVLSSKGMYPLNEAVNKEVLDELFLYIRKFLHFGTEVKKSAPVQRAQLSVMTIRKCKNLLRIRHHQGHHPL